MFARLATAVPSGAAITFTLLFAMQALIGMQSVDVPDTRQRALVRWISEDPPEELILDEFVIPDLREIEYPPTPQPDPDFVDSGTRINIARTVTVPGGPRSFLSNPFSNDGPLMVIMRVKPVYPARAAQRGLEGFVLVEFDVMASGTVSNVTVIESSSPIFERSAINAAKRFRFKARVVDGVPQTSGGVQYQFRFEMED